MSQLLIDPKILSWGDTYYIYDLWGNIEYRVIGVIFSISRMEILFEKKIGREKGMIRRRFFRLFKTYEIQIGRKPQGTVKKRYFTSSSIHIRFQRIYKTNKMKSLLLWLLLRFIKRVARDKYIEKARALNKYVSRLSLFNYLFILSLAAASISLIRLIWLTSAAPGSKSIGVMFASGYTVRSFLITPLPMIWLGRQANG